MWKKAIKYFLFLNLFFAAPSTPAAAASSPAVYVFGDSFVDVGNNNLLPDAPKGDFLPYGIDFPGRVATGRFTNGLNVIDFIARAAAAGLTISPPPSLYLSDGMQISSEGENFASGGAGILETTGNHTVLTMAQQIKDFQSAAGNLTEKVGEDLASAILSKSLAFVSAGTNDLIAIYISLLTDTGNSTQNNVDKSIASLLNDYRDQLQSIHDQGVRKFAVLGTTILGCAPVFRTLNPSAGECIEELNDLSMGFKTGTKRLLEELGASLEGFEYSFIDFYEIAEEIVAKPQEYGFTEVKAACCEMERREVLCRPNATYCGERREYLFWDGIHPTEAAFQVAAQLSLYGSPRFASPVNVHGLLLEG